jgi:hypothetical protein
MAIAIVRAIAVSNRAVTWKHTAGKITMTCANSGIYDEGIDPCPGA